VGRVHRRGAAGEPASSARLSADTGDEGIVMADQPTGDDPRQELREELGSLDERIASLRAELEELRDAGREPGDQEDGALALRTHEEEQAVLDALEQRRREVAGELGEA
jgi:hypothetical protein